MSSCTAHGYFPASEYCPICCSSSAGAQGSRPSVLEKFDTPQKMGNLVCELEGAAVCNCGATTIPKHVDGIQWCWQRHGKTLCYLELPDLVCWCGLRRSEHIDGHAGDGGMGDREPQVKCSYCGKGSKVMHIYASGPVCDSCDAPRDMKEELRNAKRSDDGDGGMGDREPRRADVVQQLRGYIENKARKTHMNHSNYAFAACPKCAEANAILKETDPQHPERDSVRNQSDQRDVIERDAKQSAKMNSDIASKLEAEAMKLSGWSDAILPIIEQREAMARLEGAITEHKWGCMACSGGLSCSAIVEFEYRLSKLREGKP